MDDERPATRILDTPSADETTLAYADRLASLERELAALERRLSEIPIGHTGVGGLIELRNEDSAYRDLAAAVSAVRAARRERSLGMIESIADPIAPESREFRERVTDGTFDEQIDRLTRLLDRSSRQLAARRQAAAARLGLTISLVALVVSTVSILFG
ncbi:hypothetical protein [Halobaculum gomorrense]|uniref:Uncharacterized protein n=1 Tax=Halobaculum gomorrense TaxID=43928 RepID=A0A1M5T8T5_9EURY|nr:hypothetical protein [Halobaculum gomorrense]SHH47131.1 hypothetical protein SAMN05443636_2680 [Halobaculum gomorrense]